MAAAAHITATPITATRVNAHINATPAIAIAGLTFLESNWDVVPAMTRATTRAMTRATTRATPARATTFATTRAPVPSPAVILPSAPMAPASQLATL
jgi:hypothetical protein